MSDGDNVAALLAQAPAHRAQARRARRLALMIGDLEATANLSKFADELDQKAATMEVEVATWDIPTKRTKE